MESGAAPWLTGTVRDISQGRDNCLSPFQKGDFAQSCSRDKPEEICRLLVGFVMHQEGAGAANLSLRLPNRGTGEYLMSLCHPGLAGRQREEFGVVISELRCFAWDGVGSSPRDCSGCPLPAEALGAHQGRTLEGGGDPAAVVGRAVPCSFIGVCALQHESNKRCNVPRAKPLLIPPSSS